MIKFLLLLFSSSLLPFFLLLSLFNKRLKATLAERLLLGGWKYFQRGNGKLIWIHAASLGEVNGVAPVLRLIKSRLPEVEVLTTCISDTGKEALSKINDKVLIFPYDHPYLAKKALDKVKPDLILIVETEIWPSFMMELGGVPVVYFNARVSDYTFNKYKLFSSLLGKVFKPVRKLFAQTELDAKRFIELGVGNVEVVGNTKSDSLNNSDFDKKELENTYKIKDKDLVIVAGSVHPGEDLKIVRAYRKLREKFSNLKLIIAPRHDFENTARVLKDERILFSRRSENSVSENVILLDKMGELSKVYSLASVAFVGGSLVDVGGHNPLEPASFAVPVVMGEFHSTVRDVVDFLSAVDGLRVVENEKELFNTFEFYLENGKEAGMKAREVFEQSRGASEVVVREILSVLG